MFSLSPTSLRFAFLLFFLAPSLAASQKSMCHNKLESKIKQVFVFFHRFRSTVVPFFHLFFIFCVWVLFSFSSRFSFSGAVISFFFFHLLSFDFSFSLFFHFTTCPFYFHLFFDCFFCFLLLVFLVGFLSFSFSLIVWAPMCGITWWCFQCLNANLIP